jgi:hypothetical protein
MPIWLTPLFYTVASVGCSLIIPRIESTTYTLSISVASAQAYFSAVTSGIMALTGIVFVIAYVVGQFTAVAYGGPKIEHAPVVCSHFVATRRRSASGGQPRERSSNRKNWRPAADFGVAIL